MVHEDKVALEARRQRVSSNDLMSRSTRDTLLLRFCERCVNDAGFRSGMVGAPRCKLIERAVVHAFTGLGYPAEWQMGSDGAVSCSAFTPDVVEHK